MEPKADHSRWLAEGWLSGGRGGSTWCCCSSCCCRWCCRGPCHQLRSATGTGVGGWLGGPRACRLDRACRTEPHELPSCWTRLPKSCESSMGHQEDHYILGSLHFFPGSWSAEKSCRRRHGHYDAGACLRSWVQRSLSIALSSTIASFHNALSAQNQPWPGFPRQQQESNRSCQSSECITPHSFVFCSPMLRPRTPEGVLLRKCPKMIHFNNQSTATCSRSSRLEPSLSFAGVASYQNICSYLWVALRTEICWIIASMVHVKPTPVFSK